MKRLGLVSSALIAVAALAAGCSSKSSSGVTGVTSTSFAGSWRLTWVSLPTGVYVNPATDTVVVTQSGSGYTVTYRDFTFQTGPSIFYSYTALNGSITAKGDSLMLHAWDATDGGSCYLSRVGTTTNGTSIVGTAAQSGGVGCPTIWTWSFAATKQ